MTHCIERLRASSSSVRRSASKFIRTHNIPNAGPFLLSALEFEISDPRTWETQYQIIMALGERGFEAALPVLEVLAKEGVDRSTMVEMALGDAIVRISDSSQELHKGIETLSNCSEATKAGGLRALAILRRTPAVQDIDRIVGWVETSSVDSDVLYWALGAAPDWPRRELDLLLSRSQASSRKDIRENASFAQRRTYRSFKPL